MNAHFLPYLPSVQGMHFSGLRSPGRKDPGSHSTICQLEWQSTLYVILLTYQRNVMPSQYKTEAMVGLPMRRLFKRDQNDTDLNNYRSPYDLNQ